MLGNPEILSFGWNSDLGFVTHRVDFVDPLSSFGSFAVFASFTSCSSEWSGRTTESLRFNHSDERAPSWVKTGWSWHACILSSRHPQRIPRVHHYNLMVLPWATAWHKSDKKKFLKTCPSVLQTNKLTNATENLTSFVEVMIFECGQERQKN